MSGAVKGVDVAAWRDGLDQTSFRRSFVGVARDLGLLPRRRPAVPPIPAVDLLTVQLERVDREGRRLGEVRP